MGAFWGLPDFGAPQAASVGEIYASYEPGPYQLLPRALRVAERDPGRPDFQLTFVRAASAGADYGVLSIRIARDQDANAALSYLRGVDPGATVAAAAFRSGVIRLVPAPGLLDLPPDLVAPSPLGWGGVDAAQWNLPLSADAATIIKAGLTSTLGLTARVEVESLGVAPRVHSTAAFDPAALLAGLLSSAASRQFSAPAIEDYFRDSPANLKSLTLEGDGSPDRDAFAAAMAGRVRAAYGRAVPSPGSEGPPWVELSADIKPGTTRWNLAEAAVVPRSWAYALDPFEAARALAKASGIEAVCREVTLSAAPLGFYDVDVQAFLPSPRTGLLDLGVVLTVPPHPPFVPAADSETVVFQPPNDRAIVHLRTSPLATLAYTRTTFADVLEGAHPRRLEGAASSETTTTLRLNVGDLPVDLIEIGAESDLLRLASIAGTLRYTSPSGTAASSPFALGSAQPRVSVAVPRDAMSPSLEMDAAPLTGSASPIHLGPLPAGPLHLTLASFEQYGRHVVSIDCAFGPGAPGPYAVDLIADGQPDAAANIATLFLTTASPTATWEYVAQSPFQAGYRWRPHGTAAWSSSSAPGLHLAASAAPAAATAWDINGVHVYLAPGDPPGRVRYVPADPTPQLDAEGRPAVTLVDTGTTAVLSLGTRCDLDAAQRNDLEVALLARLVAVDRIAFQAAAFAVGAVTLSVSDGSGGFQVVATALSLGTPPYNATFSVQLTGDQRTRAMAAIGGTTGLMKVDYPLTLSPEALATYAAPPGALVRTTDVATWFPAGSGMGHVQHVGG